MTRLAHPQRGVALIASMLILIIITLLGLSSMRSAGLQERMSGNQYDRNVVLEAAEAALREAEAIAAAPLTVTATCSNGVCPRPVVDMPDRWSDPDFTGWRAATSTRPALVTSQFIIEDMGPQPVDGTCHLQIPVEPTCLVPLYRVTAQAVATNARGTIVTLQSNIRQ